MYRCIQYFSLLLFAFSTLTYAGQGVKASLRGPATSLGEISPSLHFVDAGHVANGTGLRNRRTGTIRLDGIPPDATVIAAYLYWGWTGLSSPVPGVHNKMGLKRLIPGSLGSMLVTGTLVGSGDDPCWISGSSNFVYRANVSSFITGNGDYQIVLVPGATGSTNGADPWASSVDPPLAEGASLVVLFTQLGSDTLIYDSGLAGTSFFSDLSYVLDFDGTVIESGRVWTNIGMDGQIGGGVGGNSDTSKETTSLNSVLVAGPGAPNNDSDWNGGDGNPLPQLWDTKSHAVGYILTGGETSVEVSFTVAPDCLASVANVLTVSLP